MNRNLVVAVVVVLAAAAGFYLYKRSAEPPLPDLAPVGANLIEGLGEYSMPITAKNADVQRWFDQGLAMTYGFNHDAAERSYLKAAELDPDCAMCWWGAALVLGPHVNAGMDPANNPSDSICNILFHSMTFVTGAIQEAGPDLNVDSFTNALWIVTP